MESQTIKKKRRKRVVVYVDPDIHTEWKRERADRDKPVGEILTQLWVERSEKAVG